MPMPGFSLVALALLLGQTGFAGNTVWPKPYKQQSTTSTYSLVDSGEFKFLTVGKTSAVLEEAYERYLPIIFGSVGLQRDDIDANSVVLGVQVNVLTDDLSLTLDTDYGYELQVESPYINITANTAYGALYGIETFSQLVDSSLHVNATTVEDQPRFKFRASMIDTSRHWLPLSVILAHLDAMSYNKMNVLHWHIVDSVSFPFCSESYPEMCLEGAYTETHVYRKQDVQKVIEYAQLRGIRVVPEFDTPGHARKGYDTIPNLLTLCYGADGKPDGTTGPFNPILDSTYTFLSKFYAEIKALFTDKFVHVGGDEVSFDCWRSNPAITNWMAAHPNIKGYDELESYYEVQLLEILKQQNTSYIVWEEIFDNVSVLLKTHATSVPPSYTS